MRELDLCNRVLTALVRWPWDEACTRIVELLLDATASRFGCIGRLADDGALVCSVVSVSAENPTSAGVRTVRLLSKEWPPMWRRCMEDLQTVCENSLEASLPRISAPLRRALVIPIRDGTEVLGLLCLANRETPYVETDARLVTAAVEPLGAAFHVWREREKVEAQQREIQEKWKLTQFAVDHSPGVILTLDPGGRIIYANKTACRTLGYQPEELVRRNVRDFLDGSTAESWDRVWDELRRRRSASFEARFRTSAGSVVPLDILAGYLECDGREFIPLVCRDVSDYFAAREELSRALEREREATRLKSEFLANVNHELRTPLNGIIGMTELLLESPLTEEQREYAETIYRASHDLLKMIEDMLDLEKIEAGKLELHHGAFHPCKLLENVAGLFVKQARDKGIELSVECRPEVPSSLVGDAARIRQVLVNLVGNAVKFTPSGRIVVRAECVDSNENQVRVRFAVEDSGIGVPEDKQSFIFERFSQVDGSPTRRHEGVGLGLAIVKDLVELMGGELGIESQVGRGSVFWFTLWLPVGVSSHQAQEGGETGQAAPFPKPRWERAPRVLVVEDNPINRKVALRLLQRLGCNAEVASHGREAVELVRTRDYDLVLMDCEMPVMDGCQATRRIREASDGKRDVPIVAMTARAMKGDVQACFAAGMDDYMAKPVHVEDLRLVLEKWVRRRVDSTAAQRKEVDLPGCCRSAERTGTG